METINEHVPSEEHNGTNAYVDETSIPLRRLYQLLVDVYENAYPIPFIDFRKTFDRYMQATKNNLIDAIVLLSYGAKDIKKIGTGTEDIAVERLHEGREQYDENTKTVRSPFYRFIDMDDEIRIGYDYADVIDFIDHSKDNQPETPDNINDVVESDTIIKTHTIPRFPVYINAEEGLIIFDFKDKYRVIIDVKKMKFIVSLRGEQYDLSNSTEIELQPVPKDCSAKRSVLLNTSRVIVTEMENDTQFCFNAEHSRFEIIDSIGNTRWEYAI